MMTSSPLQLTRPIPPTSSPTPPWSACAERAARLDANDMLYQYELLDRLQPVAEPRQDPAAALRHQFGRR